MKKELIYNKKGEYVNMKKQSLLKKIAFSLGIALVLNTSTPAFARSTFVGEYAQGEILSFGSSLTKEQENKLRDYFNAPNDVETIYVTTEMVVNQLGLDKSVITTYKGGWYSSAYVKLTDGTGINVTANNLTLVTDDMLANALITSGILNADVMASAPFKVSGESALAGILAGAEEIMGEELSQENKETAQKEIETTLEVAEEIGQKEASAIMNEIKAEVIKDSPINVTQIENIVINVTNNYGIELSDKARASVVSTMSDINDLDINYKEVKNTLKEVGNKLFQDLKDALDKGEEVGMKIKESGILQKVWSWVKSLWNSFLDLFGNDNVKENGTIEEVVETDSIISEDIDSNDNSNSEEEVVDGLDSEDSEDSEDSNEMINENEPILDEKESSLEEGKDNLNDIENVQDESIIDNNENINSDEDIIDNNDASFGVE